MIYAFANYVLDAEQRELRQAGRVVALEPQIFDLLQFLICNRERVVSRDDLITAVWKKRIVSESTLSSRINAVRSAIGDNGRDQRLIKTLPKKGLRFIGAVKESRKMRRPVLVRPIDAQKPSIAVLPFANMSRDDEAYFVDGIVEEITTALSRFPSLFVTARNSAFSYKGKSIDQKRIGRELGVRYLLVGSMRKTGSKVRVTSQLILADTGVHIWAERYDGDSEHIFELQDEIASNVAGAVIPNLQKAEIERARRRAPESPEAYDLYLRALPHMHAMTDRDSREAVKLLKHGLRVDPRFALAASSLSTVLLFRSAFGWSLHREMQGDAVKYARMALLADRDDPELLARFGGAISFFLGQHREGITFVNRAVALNPNSSMAWRASGYLHSWAGEPETAVTHFDRALRLSPCDPLDFHLLTGKAVALLALGRSSEAEEIARAAIRRGPRHGPAWRCLAAALALVGKVVEARSVLAEYQRLAPLVTLQKIRSGNSMIQLPSRLFDGLRKAGLPE